MKTHISFFIILISLSAFSQKKWSLEDCIIYAEANSIEILRQQLQNQSLEEDVTTARGNYFPNLSFDASEGIRFTQGAFDASTGITTSSSNFTNFGFRSGVTLFNGNRNNYTLQQAKLAVQRGEVDIERITLDLSLDIANQYLQVLFNKELLNIAEEQQRISEQEKNRLTKLQEAALRSKSELLQMQSTYASDKKEVISIRNNLNTSLIQLKQLLSINDIEEFDILEIDVANTIEKNIAFSTSENIFQNALQNNPLIKSTELQYQINEKGIEISKSALYPSLNLSAGFNTNFFGIENGNNVFFQQLSDNQSQNISLGLNVPIFNRFATRSNIDKAKIELDITKAELANQKNELKNRIQIAHNEVITAKAVLESARIASDAQTEVFKIDQQKYQEGYMTSEDYLISKANYVRIESELVRAKYDYLFKIKVLDYYNN